MGIVGVQAKSLSKRKFKNMIEHVDCVFLVNIINSQPPPPAHPDLFCTLVWQQAIEAPRLWPKNRGKEIPSVWSNVGGLNAMWVGLNRIMTVALYKDGCCWPRAVVWIVFGVNSNLYIYIFFLTKQRPTVFPLLQFYHCKDVTSHAPETKDSPSHLSAEINAFVFTPTNECMDGE